MRSLVIPLFLFFFFNSSAQLSDEEYDAVVPHFEKSGIFFTYQDFVNGKIKEMSYTTHNDKAVAFYKDEKKFWRPGEIWGWVDNEGKLRVSSPVDKNFYKVLVWGELIFYTMEVIWFEGDKIVYSEWPGHTAGVKGYISKGLNGNWLKVSEETIEQLTGENVDCTPPGKSNDLKMVNCVLAYNLRKFNEGK